MNIREYSVSQWDIDQSLNDWMEPATLKCVHRWNKLKLCLCRLTGASSNRSLLVHINLLVILMDQSKWNSPYSHLCTERDFSGRIYSRKDGWDAMNCLAKRRTIVSLNTTSKSMMMRHERIEWWRDLIWYGCEIESQSFWLWLREIYLCSR